ncbi:phage tail protein [Burkholderia sp. TSV86]|uniref:phage tail protein n=1 Tax=Burkholderia sp. TSV86 TaxID=1385594 RepID=UPI0007573C82|nr:phage tail protein [Burkholderia sp. TSV86]KVE33909.1 hypothetical protein WS68_00875 [Burkholderia sp. TSV86]
MSLGAFIAGFVPMLRLGNFNFALNVAVFQEMHHSAEYRWPAQERFGQLPALQYTGAGEESVTLPGIIYPEWRGSANAMAMLRALAEQGQPQLMLDAQGRVYGRWVITNVEETRGTFAAFALPRKIEFTVTLKRFDGSDIAPLENSLTDSISQWLS